MPLRELTCPVCKKPSLWEGNPARPFCSDRCKMIDLGAWAAEEYRIPGKPAPDPQEERSSHREEQ
ncbi:MAG: DNA gyrase inhibitor YacG [Geobacter sp.]|nr:DNA gyrase inhibitor YacG [Geobacter sp.]